MQRSSPNKKGFSLIELIIVVGIIAIMSVGAVVGFRYMGDTLRTREASGVITDTIKKAELEILKEDYKKSTISFSSNYLVIVSEPEDKSLNLSVTDCSGGHKLDYGSDGNLIKSDGEGALLEAKTITSGTNDCITDFTDSDEIEWQYQIRSSGEVSNIVRFVHFNINRTDPSEIAITSGTGETVIVEAPYAKKTFSTTPITLTVSGEDSSEDLTIQ